MALKEDKDHVYKYCCCWNYEEER